MESLLLPKTSTDARWTGKQFVVRDTPPIPWGINNSRGGTTASRESVASYRSFFADKVEPLENLTFYDWDDELLDSISSPKSTEMENMKAGFNRVCDELVITRLFSDVYVGTQANGHNTAKAFPTANIVPVNYISPDVAPGANQPLSPWKIKRGIKMMKQMNVNIDSEELILVISPDEVEDLEVFAKNATTDMWAKHVGDWINAYYSGKSNEFKLLGCTVQVSNLLTANSSGIRNCALYAKSGILRSGFVNVKTSMDRLPEKKNAMLLQGSAMVGIGRRHDEKVIQIPAYHA